MQNAVLVDFCKSCGGEIYEGEYVYDLFPLLMETSYVIHTDCLCDCLESHKSKVVDYIFEDLSILEELFDGILEKSMAGGDFCDWGDECEFE